jgi:hypothetical protein
MSDSFSAQFDNLTASLNTLYRLLQANSAKKDITDEAKSVSLYYGKIIGILMVRNVRPKNIPNSNMDDIVNLRLVVKQLGDGNSRTDRQKQNIINVISKVLENIEKLKALGIKKGLYSAGGKRKTHKRRHSRRRHTRRN